MLKKFEKLVLLSETHDPCLQQRGFLFFVCHSEVKLGLNNDTVRNLNPTSAESAAKRLEHCGNHYEE